MQYAEKTTVSVEKTKAEIERILQKYGAEQFIHGWDANKAVVMFRLGGRQIKFVLILPDKNDASFQLTPGRQRKRSTEAAFRAWEQACRQRWRALCLVIKAKLEAVESGITTLDDEFMAHIMLPDGSTVAEFMGPQIQIAYEKGEMPKLLPL